MVKNRLYLWLLLCTPYTMDSANSNSKIKVNWQKAKAEQKAAREAKKSNKRHAKKGEEGTIRVLETPLDGSRDYDQDDTNFLSPKNKRRAALQGEIDSIKKVTTKPIVLVNSHGTDELYLGPAISGEFVSGKHRTLNWGCSLEDADTMIKHQLALHESLALPLVWSGNRYRTHVTFTIIPAGTEIEFKKGEAAAQKKDEDYRPGGGQQIRMKYIPAHAITITKKLLPDNKEAIASQKGMKSIDFRQLLEDGINEYNSMHPHLNQFDAKQLARESYYSKNFEESLSEITENISPHEENLEKGLFDSDTQNQNTGMQRANAFDNSESESKDSAMRAKQILISSRNETDEVKKIADQARLKAIKEQAEQEEEQRQNELAEHEQRARKESDRA